MMELLLEFFRWLYLTIGPVFSGSVMALLVLGGLVTALVLPFALLQQSHKLYLTSKTSLLKSLYHDSSQRLLEEASRRLDIEDLDECTIHGRTYHASVVFAGGRMYQCVSVDLEDEVEFCLKLLCPSLVVRPFDGFGVNPDGGCYSFGGITECQAFAGSFVSAYDAPDILASWSARQIGKRLHFERRGKCPDANEIVQIVHVIADIVELLEEQGEQALYDAFVGIHAAGLDSRRIVTMGVLLEAFPADRERRQGLLRRCLAACAWGGKSSVEAACALYRGYPELSADIYAALDTTDATDLQTALATWNAAGGREEGGLWALVVGARWGGLLEFSHIQALKATVAGMSTQQAAVEMMLICAWLELVGQWDAEGKVGIDEANAGAVCAALEVLEELSTLRGRGLICHAVLPLLHVDESAPHEPASVAKQVASGASQMAPSVGSLGLVIPELACRVLGKFGSPAVLESLEQYKATAPSPVHATRIARLIERIRDDAQPKVGALSLVAEAGQHSGAVSLLSGELGDLSLVSEGS